MLKTVIFYLLSINFLVYRCEAAETGRKPNILLLMASKKSGIVESGRDAVCAGRERHAWCRIEGLGYPGRMIRTRDYLYIRNYQPDCWPAGDYRVVTNEGEYGDIDQGVAGRRIRCFNSATSPPTRHFDSPQNQELTPILSLP